MIVKRIKFKYHRRPTYSRFSLLFDFLLATVAPEEEEVAGVADEVTFPPPPVAAALAAAADCRQVSGPCSAHLHRVQNEKEQLLLVQLATLETERSTTEGKVQRGQRCNSSPGLSLAAFCSKLVDRLRLVSSLSDDLAT